MAPDFERLARTPCPIASLASSGMFKGLPAIDPGVAVHEWKQGTMAMSEAEFMAIIKSHGLFVDRSRQCKASSTRP